MENWKNNRPDGWKNPYVECNKVCKKIYNGKPFDAVEITAFEAGADAIVKEILIKLQAIYNLPDGGMFHNKMGEFIKELKEEVK